MNVSLQAWMVMTWKPVCWMAPEDPTQWPAWTHVTTRVHEKTPTESQLFRGDTVWTADVEDGQLGVAWEWVEWQPGVIILSDPMAICSNIASNEESPKHGPHVRAITLNRVAHALPWQDRVIREIKGAATTAAPPVPPHRRPQHQLGHRHAA